MRSLVSGLKELVMAREFEPPTSRSRTGPGRKSHSCPYSLVRARRSQVSSSGREVCCFSLPIERPRRFGL